MLAMVDVADGHDNLPFFRKLFEKRVLYRRLGEEKFVLGAFGYY